MGDFLVDDALVEIDDMICDESKPSANQLSVFPFNSNVKDNIPKDT